MIYHSKPIDNAVIEVRRTNILTSLYYKLHPEWKRFGFNRVYRKIDNYFVLKAIREGVIKT